MKIKLKIEKRRHYSIFSLQKCQRGARTTQQQYVAYLDFLDSHPEFLQKSLSVSHNEVINANEWDELTELLNSMSGSAPLSKIQWDARLTDWRHKLNARHRKLIIEANSTGGGPPNNNSKQLKDYELRAIGLFNATPNTGNRQLLMEAGIDQQFQVPQNLLPPEPQEEEVFEEEIVEEYLSDHDLFDDAEQVEHVDGAYALPNPQPTPQPPPQPNPTPNPQTIHRVRRPERTRKVNGNGPNQQGKNIEAYMNMIQDIEKRKEAATKENVNAICGAMNNFASSLSELAAAVIYRAQQNSTNHDAQLETRRSTGDE